MWRALLSSVATVCLLAGCGNDAAPQHDPAADGATIEAALRQWPHDFNNRDQPKVCGLFAEDVVFAEPDIREVLVAGDLATVRLFWTLTVSDPSGAVLKTVVEDGLDVFQRQDDGSWKINISHAFTVD